MVHHVTTTTGNEWTRVLDKNNLPKLQKLEAWVTFFLIQLAGCVGKDVAI